MDERSNHMYELARKMLARADSRLLRQILDAVPNAMFLADESAVIIDLNAAASSMAGWSHRAIDKRLCGTVLRCINAYKSVEGCGASDECPNCVLRHTIKMGCGGQAVLQKYAPLRQLIGDAVSTRHLLVTAVPFEHEGAFFALFTLEDVTDLLDNQRPPANS